MAALEAHEYGTEQWISDFGSALAAKDSSTLSALFSEESYYRDNVAFTWDYRQAVGSQQIVDLLLSVVDDIAPSNFRLSTEWPEPGLVGYEEPLLLEFFMEFDTAVGGGTAIVRGIPDTTSPYGFRAFKLFTRLDTLRGFEPGEAYSGGRGFEAKHQKQNWLQNRDQRQSYSDREPEVLIVGGGHSGMMAAARLGKLGVDALIVDKNERVGDNWRKRYHNLALHTPTHMAQLPYLRYPDNFPEYISKDKLANWFETYAESLDLNYWTSTEFLGATFDDEAGTWSATIRKADGTERVLHPKHMIMCTGGVGGFPKIPNLPGLDTFAGDAMHSSKFTRGEDYAGKNAIVVGVGTSAHDIALDLYTNGANVTMLQRNPVAIVSIDSANAAYSDYFNGVPDVLVDFRFNADGVYPLLVKALHGYQQAVAEWDKDILERLEAVGMKLEDVRDGEHSWIMKFYRNGGGYYLNIGASDIIADGGIKVIQSDDLDTLTAEGARMNDGSLVPADVIVMATGYEGRQTELEALFGEEVAERVGPVGRGFDTEGEWTNVWKPTAQKGLWFMLGGVNNARPNSQLVALNIKAELEGLVPPKFRGAQQSLAASTS